MTTRRETILAAVRTALTGTTGVSTRIYRSRVEPMARAESPAIVVEPALMVAEQAQGDRALYVALTRATKRLAVVHEAPLPPSLLP